MLNIIRFLLFPFSILYGIVTGLRNWLFNLGILKEYRFEVPIISIGNLNVGGTGKTPHVILLARYFLNKGMKVAVLSRGYKRKSRGFLLANHNSSHVQIGDEPMELFNKLPKATIAVSESRVEGIRTLMNLNEPPELIILDDAYQHRYVKPAVSILLTTYQNPYFKDYVLPKGRLREFRIGKRRADLVIVTKLNTELTKDLQNEFSDKLKLNQSQKVFYSKMVYHEFYGLHNPDIKLEINEKSNVFLFTAIADNKALINYLNSKFELVKCTLLPDHHSFSLKNVQNVINQFEADKTEQKAILITAKDAVKLKDFEILKNYPVYVIEMGVQLHDQEKFYKTLHNKLGS